jgi:hypothetical protein
MVDELMLAGEGRRQKRIAQVWIRHVARTRIPVVKMQTAIALMRL